MRQLLILLFVPLAFGCANFTLAELANASKSFGYLDCLYIIDTNTTIATEGYVANRNISLGFGENYTNSSLNLSLSCPIFPAMNLDQNLTAGDIYTNSTYNITIRAVPKKYNINNSLTYLENYSNDEVNITLRAPAVPKYSTNKSLTYGENYTHADSNVSCYAPPFPRVNLNKALGCGESWANSDLNVSFTTVPCLNINKTLAYGEKFNSDAIKVSLAAPDKPSRNIQLSDGEKFEDEIVKASCTTPAEKYLRFCQNMSDADVVALWQKINATEPCITDVRVCVDNLTQYCSLEERFNGEKGFINCYNRNLENITNICSATEDRLNICNQERGQLAQAAENSNETMELANDLFAKVLLLVGIVAGLAYLGYRKLGEKKMERGYDGV